MRRGDRPPRERDWGRRTKIQHTASPWPGRRVLNRGGPGGVQKEHQPHGHCRGSGEEWELGYRTQALLHLSPRRASDAPSQSMRQWSVHTPQRCVPFSELFLGQITAGYIHEVHHATAGLQAEALGAQVFVCKRNRFQHPSPVGFPGLPQPWDQGGMIPVPWRVQSSSVSA